MNILNDIVRGASTQFGREFGRAGANAILKGKNYYNIKSESDYSGRIKPSDSDIVKAIKEINKIKFVTTNKANISRLIDLTDLVIDNLSFNGVSTLNEITDIKNLISDYNDKFEHGSVLIDDDYKDKSLDYLNEKRQSFADLLTEFNSKSKDFVNAQLRIATLNKKEKSTATILSCPFLLVGLVGAHHFYLGRKGYSILYLLLNFAFGVTALISLINFIQLLFMSKSNFDNKYNGPYLFYSQFSFSE